MDFVAQLVRASVCGSEGRGFETHRGPQKLSKKAPKYRSFFYAFLEDLNTDYFKKFPYPFIKIPSSFLCNFFFQCLNIQYWMNQINQKKCSLKKEHFTGNFKI